MTLHGTRYIAATVPPADDPWRYGSRSIPVTHPDGRVTFDQVPLSEDDAWHPQEEDCLPEDTQHVHWSVSLYNGFTACLAADPTTVVFSNMLMVWDHPTIRPTAPDVTIVRGVRERRVWRYYNLAAEGARVMLALEILSLSTVERDRKGKKDEYEELGVPVYVMVDALSAGRLGSVRVEGYTLGPTGYEPLVADERGWLWLEPVGLWLGVDEDRPRLYDAEGNLIPDYQELAEIAAEAETRAASEAIARAEAETRATSEAIARAEAEARLRALEAELRRLRGEA